MMDFLPKEPYKRVFVVTFYFTIACVLFYVFFRFFWVPLLPFLLAFLLAAFITPIAKFLQRKFRIPQKLSAFLLLIVFLGGSVFLLYSISCRLISEAGEFLASESMQNTDTGRLTGILQKRLCALFPSAATYLESQRFSSAIRTTLRSLATALTEALPGVLSGILTKLPMILFFVVVMSIAAYYLATEKKRIFSTLHSILPQRIQAELSLLRHQAGQGLLKYLRAATVLLLLTFLELFVGLWLLRVPYALSLAAIISLVDFFPILGTGTVMVPWALGSLLSGKTTLALGLLLLWAIVSAVRQALEPRIIGAHLGLHPFHALVAMYFGFSLFGLTGLVLSPLAVTILIGVAREKRAQSAQK